MINFINKHRYDLVVLLVLFFTAVIAYLLKDEFDVFADRAAFENMIAQLGVWGTLEVIIAPIPGYIPAITAGFIFGPLMGTIYVFIGNVL